MVRVLQKNDDLSSFDCDDLELNLFLKKYAKQNQFRHYIGTTYVYIYEEKIIGFATVSVGSIRSENIQNISKYPKYPLPILRISRLAIDKSFKNQGFGKELLKFAINIAKEQKDKCGCIGILVDAKEKSVKFYEKFGFEILEVKSGNLDIRPYPKVMFLSMKTILKAG